MPALESSVSKNHRGQVCENIKIRLKVFFIGKLIEIQNRDFLLSLENVKREDAGDQEKREENTNQRISLL